jgi:hypothetical protein
MRVIDLIWNIGPIFRRDFTIHWLDFCDSPRSAAL